MDPKRMDAKMEGEQKVKVFSVYVWDWEKGFRFREGAIMLAMRRRRGEEEHSNQDNAK